MAITKNESLQSMMNRLVPQGGTSINLAGSKPSQTSLPVSNSSPTKLKTNTFGQVSDRDLFSFAREQQGYNREQDRLNRSAAASQSFANFQTALSDRLYARDQDNAQFKFAQDQARRSNAQNTINQGRAFHQSKVNAAQQWEAMSNQNQQAADNNRLENKKARFGLISNLAQVGAQRQQSQLQFEAAQLSNATNQKQIESTERTTSQRTEADREVGNNQAKFGLFANLMDNLAAAPQGNRFGYLNI